MYGLIKKIVSNKPCIHEWASSAEEFMAEIIGEEEIGIEALEGQYFDTFWCKSKRVKPALPSYIFQLDCTRGSPT